MSNDAQQQPSNQNVQPKKAKKIPSLPKHWEDYFLSMLFVLILPLIPVIIELWRGGKVDIPELMLTASMYAISVGISSTSRLMFGLSIVMGVMYAFAYGATKSQPTTLPSSELVAYISITVIFLLHSLERYNIHIVELKPWEFPGDGRK